MACRPVNGPITSRFGAPFYLDSGATYQGRRYPHFNKGVDFGVGGGTTVQAVVAGIVQLAADDGAGWGPRVVIVDADGFEHSYGHLGSIAVRPGQQVGECDPIGTVGHGAVETSTGPHLSYDIFRDGEPVDPSPWLGEDVRDPSIPAAPASAGPRTQTATALPRTGTGGPMPTLSRDQQRIAAQIAQAAWLYAVQQGLDERMADRFARTAVSIAWQESGLNPMKIGDDGHSVGIFQLHDRGRGLGMSVAERQDPRTNIATSLPELFMGFQAAHQAGLGFDQTPVEFVQKVSEIAQRPDPTALAQAGPQFAEGLSIPLEVATGGIAPGAAGPQGNVRQIAFPNLQPTTQQQGIDAAANALPPAATPADALESLIQKRITEITTSGDPDALFDLPMLANTLQSIRVLKGEASPDTIADLATRERIAGLQTSTDKEIALLQIANQQGITAANIQAEKDNLNTRLAFEADQNAQDRAIRVMEVTGDQALARDRLDFDREQAARTYGIDLRRLTVEERAQAAQEAQFELSFGLEQEVARRGLALEEKRFGLEQQRFGLEQQEALRLEKKDTLSALVDLIKVQVDAGAISESAAENALDNLVEIYLATGGGLDYMPGFEPGGVYATNLAAIGGTYDPGAHRIRPFPLDLESMAQSMGKFDLSQAWGTARDLLGQAGFDTGTLPGQGFTPPPGGSLQSTFGAAPPGQQAPMAQGQPGAMPPGQQPQYVPPQGLPGQPGVPQSFGRQPPAQPPAQNLGTMPGTAAPATAGTVPKFMTQPPGQQQQPGVDPHTPCPFGQQKVWDGHRFLCR